MPKPSSSSVKIFYPRRSRDEIIRAVQRGVLELATEIPIVEAVVFGSVASGRQTVASDVDVLIVYRGAPRDDVFLRVKDLIQLRGVEPHVYSESEGRQARDVLDRMIRDGIRVYPVGGESR